MPGEFTPVDPTKKIRAHQDVGSLGGIEVSSLSWRSARCSTQSCVEIADLPDGGAAVRDGKLHDDSPILVFTSDEWHAFLAGVKDGEFD